ncbi:uncharacterized protein LOC132725654 [Ruditapes philippinarum]|uniref:uncharacterized protein LOC132725654 n=1 Tax=Ruditapes philippinarum TaxID=129788 RepID=UPI00295B37F0|nr:uncharacterized protein LOC132725654 [Ruditapes philippinarum]
MVAGLLGAVPSFKKLSSSRSDDWIDRMSHIYSVFLLVIFAVLVSTGQFVGDPIHCWCPAQFTGAFEAYTKNYCWIKNTYYIPMMETIPIDIHKRQEAEITYYQWVPLILLFQAFLFKFPNVLWKMLNGGSGLNLDKICKLADETQWGSPDDRKGAIENMSFFLDRWLLTHRQYKHNFVARAKAKASRVFCFLCNKREGTFLTALYLCIKVLYLANVIGQFFLLNAFMATDYNMYGFEYIKMLNSGESMRESPRFPRVTLCDFRIRQLQNIQRWTVQCVLPINLFNEKIFIFLWFWFFFIAFLCGFNLVKWLFLIVLKRNNYQYVKKYLTITDHMQTASDKKLCHRFAEQYLRDDGCFVARMIGMNSTDMVITDLLDCMWRNYRLREEPRPEYPEDEESKLIDKEKDTSPLDFRGNNVQCCRIVKIAVSFNISFQRHFESFSSVHAKFKESCRTDDWADRLSHLFTAGLLLIFAILVSTVQFVGENRIKCWAPAELKEFHESYINNYCWISNTYYIPMLETIPTDVQQRQEEEITYYQWVPLILAFQALMFHFPNFIWNLLNVHSGLNLGKIRALADETQSEDPKKREEVIKNLSKVLQRWIQIQRPYKHNVMVRAKARFSHIFCLYCNKREGNFLTGLYLCTKVMYLSNVIGQFFLLSSFLDMDFKTQGVEYVNMMRNGEPMKESSRFPRVTMCDFEVRQLNNIQRFTVQCVLPINLFNERVFIFLWFWFVVVAVSTCISFIKWVYLIVIKKNNYDFVKKYLVLSNRLHNETDKQLCRRFAEDYLRNDGCFVARTIGKNSTELVVIDVLEHMWREYKRKELNEPESDDENERKRKEQNTLEKEKKEEVLVNNREQLVYA